MFFTRILRRDLHEQGSGLVFILLLIIIKKEGSNSYKLIKQK
ncbi:hypothetical protein P378_20335 [Desulforamulus profundi]|uniref:Uncharacterized protein n=1 Tax=Desulforamulus profundi TaxID=1383067 RepID=A0A2C6MC20_9FIRM|nr:hypothetical protein P378_20335 [Desulforamulus profundi]